MVIILVTGKGPNKLRLRPFYIPEVCLSPLEHYTMDLPNPEDRWRIQPWNFAG